MQQHKRSVFLREDKSMDAITMSPQNWGGEQLAAVCQSLQRLHCGLIAG